ncbi:mitochondrial carrier domain-containing protein [Spinellus fusiger]|nr:mitochondrial carrier domain-containing protein [Spinellus fusiger]
MTSFEASPIELYSPQYFAACGLGGLLACGPTHSLVTPLDLVKCRSQVRPDRYKGTLHGWRQIVTSEGLGRLFTGVGPTAIGYSLQGMGKYGLYEVFKHYYGQWIGEKNAQAYRSLVYLSASATAECMADVLLCPMEALKVKMQTAIPPFARNTREGIQRIMETEGIRGFYRGLGPLWARQIPYTMAKFASFEKAVEMIYSTLMKEPSDCTKLYQLGVSFAGGYSAGIVCAVISQPADVLVSQLNQKETGDIKTKGIDRIKALGFNGLWRGLGMRVVMVGTLTALQWLIYDTFKVYVGFPTTGSTKDKQ